MHMNLQVEKYCQCILGDFRALDTMFEGLVLIIAGLGIYTLLNYKDRRDKMKENDVVLKSVTKL